MIKGLEIFNETAGCAACHILKAAGSECNIGPNLDTVSMTIESVTDMVTNGLGVMPAFGEDEIQLTSLFNLLSLAFSCLVSSSILFCFWINRLKFFSFWICLPNTSNQVPNFYHKYFL